MDKTTGLYFIKLGCLLFWGCWFAIASMTNVFDFLYAIDVLPKTWVFRSGNYGALGSVFRIYFDSPVFLNVMFIADFSVQMLSAGLFYLAFIFVWSKRNAWFLINTAFALSMALWAAFLIFEEIFLAYTYEPIAINLIVIELLTLLAVHFLPENEVIK